MVSRILGLMVMMAAQPAMALTAPNADLMKPIARFQAAFNRADMTMPTDIFVPGTAVADGFAPYVWSGAGAVKRWFAGLVGETAADQNSFRVSRYHLTLSAPVTVRVTGDDAYLVLPALDRWSDKKGTHFEKAYWLITEHRTATGWRISSHSWTITASR